MESPINAFIDWLESEKENGYTQSISFIFLCEFPGFGLEKYMALNRRDNNQLLKEYLTSITDPKQILGMCLCVQSIVNFTLRDWDNVDDALDKAQMYEPNGTETERELEALQKFKKMHFNNIAPRKDLKESWDRFIEEYFNDDTFYSYSLSSAFNRGLEN
jgi:hypothetical protein